jgi:hypothetical protein
LSLHIWVRATEGGAVDEMLEDLARLFAGQLRVK